MALYVSHGAPTLLTQRRRSIIEVLTQLGRRVRSEAVHALIVASPHWVARGEFLVNTSPRPRCIQDYYGFPKEFYSFRYEAPNDPELAQSLIEHGSKSGLMVRGSEDWGLDHGAWVPLHVMLPEQDIPVVPVSISTQSPEAHFQWGRLLAKTVQSSDKRVVVMGTGSPSHRLDLVVPGCDGSAMYAPAAKFDELLITLLERNDHRAVLELERSEEGLFAEAAPEGRLNALYLVLGSVGEEFKARVLCHEPFYYGVSLIAVEFSPGLAAPKSSQ